MAMLALKALNVGADTKIADHAFHAVPGGYFRPPDTENPLKFKKKKNKEKKGKQDDNSDSGDNKSDSRERRSKNRHSTSPRRQASDDDSGSDSSDGDRRADKRPERPVRRNRRYQSSKDLDRGYDSDTMTHDRYQQSRGAPLPQPAGQYFPPPPHQAYEDDPNYRQQDQYDSLEGPPPSQRYSAQQSYSPNRYYEQPAPQNQLNNAPRSPSAAPPDQYRSGSMYAPSAEPQQSYQPKRSSINPAYIPHATYGEQYSAGYQPSQTYYPPQAGQPQPYQGALAVQKHVQQPMTGYSTAIAPYAPPIEGDRGYSTYQPPKDDYTPSSSPSPERRDRRSKSIGSHDGDRSKSRDRSRERRGRDDDRDSKSKNRNRSKSVADKAKQMINKNRDIGASVLGVLAGGLIGSEMGKGNKFGTLTGAVLGGLGANVLEKQHAEKKQEKERREREKEKEKELAREREKRRERQQRDKERRNSKPSQNSSRKRDYRPRSPDYYPVRGVRSIPEDRSPRPYVRSNPTFSRSKTTSPSRPRPKSPQVRFARTNPQEFVKSATAKATVRGLHSRSDHDASEQTTRDMRTQISPDQKYRQKSSMKKAIEREVPREKIVQAAKKLKASRKGVFDGTVVEEVFLEMTGVTIGAPDIMASDWKN